MWNAVIRNPCSLLKNLIIGMCSTQNSTSHSTSHARTLVRNVTNLKSYLMFHLLAKLKFSVKSIYVKLRKLEQN